MVQLRYSGHDADLDGTITEAFQSGMELVRATTDEGNVDGAEGNVRYITTAEPSGWASAVNGQPAINGQVVEILFYGETVWMRFRVATRLPLEGAVRLNLTAEFGGL